MLNVRESDFTVNVGAAPRREFRGPWNWVDGFVNVVVWSVIEYHVLELVGQLNLSGRVRGSVKLVKDGVYLGLL